MKSKKAIITLTILLTAAVLASCDRDYESTLAIRTSNIPHAGNGVFATVFIPEGTVLGHYGGKFITKEEHRELYKQNKWHYVMRLLDCAAQQTGGYTRIDGREGNVFTRINHAPKEFQNVRFKKICNDPFVLIIATRNIKVGEELYIDYGPNYEYDFMKDGEVLDFFDKLRSEKRPKAR